MKRASQRKIVLPKREVFPKKIKEFKEHHATS